MYLLAIAFITKKMDLIQVSLDNIDLSSDGHDRYLFTYGRDSNAVTDSVKKVGLINPVILRQSQDADMMYTVVSGYQRIRACQNLGMKSIKATAIEGFHDEEILLLAFHDNLFSRGFNVIEKAIAMQKFLREGYSYDRLISEITPLLDLPQNKNMIDKYLFLLRLDGDIKHSIAVNKLEPEKAFLLEQLDDYDSKIVCRVIFEECGTSVNEAKETIRNLLDLEQIKRCGMDEILYSEAVGRILSDSMTGRRQKGERIYRLIKTMRYPSISRMEEEFCESCGEMGLDNDVRVNHSRFFEGDEICITIKASNEEKLRVNIEKLLSNIKNGKFRKIFTLLG